MAQARVIVTWVGREQLEARLRAYERADVLLQKQAQALYLIAEEIITEAKRLCPVDTGTLRSTGHVELPDVKTNAVEVTLGFGGPAAPYALVQHERMDYQHTVGQAKYLEIPFKEAKQRVGERVRGALGEFMRLPVSAYSMRGFDTGTMASFAGMISGGQSWV